VPDTRVGWSSVVGDPETGNVYALGVCGLFLCIDGKSGETIWSRPLHEELGFLSTYGGRTNFPIVHEGNVIVSAVFIGWGEMAKPNHRFLALDKRTGEVVWFNGTTDLPDDTTYSAPALAVISGVTSLVAGGGDGAIWSIQPRTGKPNWSYGFSRRGLNVPPLVVGDLVFSGHSEEVWDPASSKMGGVVGFQPEGQGALPTDKVLWRNDGMMCGKSAPVLLGDRVYIFEDGGALHILNAKTGEEIPLNIDRKIEKQIKFRNMRSNPLVADGKIYAVSEAGQWLIARPDAEKGLDVVAFSGRDKQIDETYASPIASHGRIYVTTMAGMYCLEDAAKEHGTAEVPAQPAETPAADDPKPAQVQVVPAEVLLRPGEQVKFTARLFNARGQFLREEPYPLYSAKGSGNITPSGKYTAPEDAAHQAVYVTATVGDIEGVARIRVM
ncbi:MAG: PQQ-binding-like beta-propeller repeat protein, partial [Planctomycetales bacterium]|nr:PQQ-binding-like beta-propeller repeat protein [Planctomycetales bacterium]